LTYIIQGQIIFWWVGRGGDIQWHHSDPELFK